MKYVSISNSIAFVYSVFLTLIIFGLIIQIDLSKKQIKDLQSKTENIIYKQDVNDNITFSNNLGTRGFYIVDPNSEISKTGLIINKGEPALILNNEISRIRAVFVVDVHGKVWIHIQNDKGNIIKSINLSEDRPIGQQGLGQAP